ncbi:hypothetical protein [Pedobacter sp. CFBP9032]|uniref:hypothetical protein n=1 Tax=Pedobacter sp. CFBP9032 TaxID=3096539 RepID=UPI002A6A52CC|nr:hypothetical protein [Pedobacter sp. CFBP9032]MDY0904102.1 hypothetical protein [Pedobacter sp. CFBP9032]
MILVNDNLPTSMLLDIKVGDTILNDKGLSGVVVNIAIQETDDFLMLIFGLQEGGQITTKKLRQVC